MTTKVFFCLEFIKDLQESDDPRLIIQVMRHCLDNNGNFLVDSDDHPFEGIKDAWIRVISRGNTAFRVIFIRKGEQIFLYRAGAHKIENRLLAPVGMDNSIPLVELRDLEFVSRQSKGYVGQLLKTNEPNFLNKEIISMYHVKCFELILVSPFVEPAILNRQHHFGRYLDRAVEDGTVVTLITRPPEKKDLPELLQVFKNLEERAIFVYFLYGLHTKLYIFNIDTAGTPHQHDEPTRTKVILGSANLTKPGFGLDDDMTSYELCYDVPLEKQPEAYEYAHKLIKRSVDYRTFEFKINRS